MTSHSVLRAPTLGLIFGVMIAQTGQGLAKDYTKCWVENPDAYSGLCLPDGTAGASSDVVVSVNKASAAHDTVVVSVPARNCRNKTSRVRGGVSVVLDNSFSMTETDPGNDRLTAVREFLTELNRNAQSQAGLIAPNDKDYPRVGVVSYGGRQGTETSQNGRIQFEADNLNRKFTKRRCVDGDDAALVPAEGRFPLPPFNDRWLAKPNGRGYVSICELLPLVGADVTGTSGDTTPSITRHADFLSESGRNPRGATDMVYFFEAAQQKKLLGYEGPADPNAPRARNAIIIGDGLPNVPRRRAADECRALSYLKNEPLQKDPDAPNPDQEFCVDRNFREAVEGLPAGSGKPPLTEGVYPYLEGNENYRVINAYNVLFVGQGRAFVDADDKGEYNPADFLIEASARTGNGKVKFKYARNGQELRDYIFSTLEGMDEAALQRVEVKVNNNASYNAVSPSQFGKDFSLKFIDLKPGQENTVQVRYIYSDRVVTQTYKVNVDNGGATTAPFKCDTADGGLTVDGDNPQAKDPKGDGVLPFPKGDTRVQDRVYRNADESNRINPRDFDRGLVSAQSTADKAPLDPSKLKLQGGTGNCGVVAGGFRSLSQFWLILLPNLLAIASVIATILHRRRQK